jgi:nitrogen-specific signal transduction histidine kinase
MRFNFFLKLLFLFTLFSTQIQAQESKKILVINSYNYGFVWSDKIIDSMKESFSKHSHIDMDVLFMDFKRIHTPSFLKHQSDAYEMMLKDRKYDLIVAIDNFAYYFILQNYAKLFKDEPIFFIGMERFNQAELTPYKLQRKVSGVLERRSIYENILNIQELIPKLKHLYIINDGSLNGNDTDLQIKKVLKKINKNMKITYIRESTLEKLKKKFSTYKKDEAIFFIRFYNGQKSLLSKNRVAYKNSQIADFIDGSAIPVFVTDSLFMGEGATGGKLVDISKLGNYSAQAIIGQLQNNSSIPFVKTYSEYSNVFDYEKVKNFRLKISSNIKEIHIVNQPISFFEKYRKYIDIASLLLPIFLLLSMILIYNIYRRYKNAKLLQERIEFNKVLLNSIKSAIVWQDKNGNIIDFNSKFIDLVNIKHNGDKEEFIKEHIQTLGEKKYKRDKIVLKDSKKRKYIYSLEQANYIDSIYSNSGTVTICTNITKEVESQKEKVKNQEFIIQQSKLAEIGEIFSSIAHQWKSPLVEIATIAQEHQYESTGELDTQDNKYVSEIMFQVNYMTQTLNDFQNFIMPSARKSVFDINETVVNMMEIVRHNMKYNYIKVDINMDSTSKLLVYGYKNELMQSLLNIVSNAKDAILLSVKNEKTQQGLININIFSLDNYAQIDIINNGGRIEKKVLQKVFDAYYSTKKDGHGIGLYMTKLIIEDKMSGRISVENTDIGAKFTIKLELYNENITA